MKEVHAIARNLLLTEGRDEVLVGLVEVIVIVSEPTHRVHNLGGLERQLTTETLRFNASAKSLRSIADDLKKYADEVEALEARADGKQAQL